MTGTGYLNPVYVCAFYSFPPKHSAPFRVLQMSEDIIRIDILSLGAHAIIVVIS